LLWEKPFLLHFLGQKAGKESPAVPFFHGELEASRGDTRVQGGRAQPHGRLSSGLFLAKPRQDSADRGQRCSLKLENPAPHNGVSCQKLL